MIATETNRTDWTDYRLHDKQRPTDGEPMIVIEVEGATLVETGISEVESYVTDSRDTQQHGGETGRICWDVSGVNQKQYSDRR